jgi:hypothetical protein
MPEEQLDLVKEQAWSPHPKSGCSHPTIAKSKHCLFFTPLIDGLFNTNVLQLGQLVQRILTCEYSELL